MQLRLGRPVPSVVSLRSGSPETSAVIGVLTPTVAEVAVLLALSMYFSLTKQRASGPKSWIWAASVVTPGPVALVHVDSSRILILPLVAVRRRATGGVGGRGEYAVIGHPRGRDTPRRGWACQGRC